MSYALGVDLGTTHTAAALVRDGRSAVVSLGTRSLEIPSVAFLRDDGVLVVGEAAEYRGRKEPTRFARDFKRRLGDPTPILLAGSPFSAAGLMAALLRQVVGDVAQREGEAPDRLALTYPANWGPYKRELFTQIVDLADLPGALYTTEPQAAAVNFASTSRVAAGESIAVYDLGGGTFDAAVLRKTGDGFELLGEPQGIEQLGGVDFDEAVFGYVARALGDRLRALDRKDPAVVAGVTQLRRDCVAAKEALSTDTEAAIPVLLPGMVTEIRLTRVEFETLIRPALERTIVCMRRALRSAGVADAGVKTTVLAGGSSRIPLVGEMIQSELSLPVAVGTHPKHSVALGAATLASTAGVPGLAPTATEGASVDEHPRPLGQVASATPARSAEGLAPPPWPAPPDEPPVPAPGPAMEPPPSRGARQTPVPEAAPRVSPAPGRAPNEPGPGRSKLLLLLIPAVLAVIAVLAVVLTSGGDDGGNVAGTDTTQVSTPATDASTTPTGATTTADATTTTETSAEPTGPTVTETLSLDSGPFQVSVAQGSLWATGANTADTVTRIDLASGEITATIPVSAVPSGVAAVDSAVWITSQGENTVLRLVPATNEIAATIPVGVKPFSVFATDDDVWVTNETDGTLSRIDPATNTVIATIPVGNKPNGVTEGAGAVWVTLLDDNAVARVDPATNTVVATVPVGGRPFGVIEAAGSIWVTGSNDNSLTRIDPTTNGVLAKVTLGGTPVGLAFDGESLWVANASGDSVSRVDPATNRVIDTVIVGAEPFYVATADGEVWVANFSGNSISSIDPGSA